LGGFPPEAIDIYSKQVDAIFAGKIMIPPINIYSKQVDVFLAGQKKRRECFLMHEIGRIDSGRGFRTGRNVFQIGGNKF
jgi:hypothetical protein